MQLPVELPFTVGRDCPYTFAARTVGDMIRYIVETKHGEPRYDYHDGSPFAWKVKAHNVNIQHNGDGQRTPALDGAWERFLDTPRGQYVHEEAFDGAQRYYREEWTAYPGDDQGDWRFSFRGRSGGWLCLDSWRGYRLDRMAEDELAGFFAMLVYEFATTPDDALARLYVGFVCADQDFTSKNSSEEVSHHYGFQRGLWEEAREDADDIVADAMLKAGEQTANDYGIEFNRSVAAKALGAD